ncbi:TrkH family potassium uptake protein [bacterium]|nr:TrkH family potassium uptake protein [bacterium]
MRPQIILWYTGLILVLNSVFLFVSTLVSLIYFDSALFPLAYSTLIVFLFGIFPIIFVTPTGEMSNKEGLAILIIGWLLSCLFGTIPYVLWGGEFSFTNAWFESVSGFTTTGSSILTNVEALPNGLLFWRSTTHWIGGMGIIVFVLAVLPTMGFAGMTLYRSEVSHLTMGKLSFNTRKAAKVLITVYVGLTAVEAFLLILGGMSIFDSVTHSFATIATGGFSVKNESIAYYNSLYFEMVIIAFMIVSGVHFGLLYKTISNRFRNLERAGVVKYYLAILFIGVVITTIYTRFSGPFDNIWTSFRYATFQIVSIGTSTGFATSDTNMWPPVAKVLIIFFTFQCACAGSTSGGIKVDRMILFGKTIVKKTRQLLHPHAIIPVNLDGKEITPNALEMSVLYVSLYIFIVFISTILITLAGVNSTEAFTGSAAAMGNVGPGLGAVGSMGNYSTIPSFGKWVLSGTMLLGRLEIFGFIIFLSRSTWRN